MMIMEPLGALLRCLRYVSPARWTLPLVDHSRHRRAHRQGQEPLRKLFLPL